MRLFVKDQAGASHSLCVDADISVGSLKELIEDKTGIPADAQVLSGIVASDATSLADLDICDSFTVQVSANGRGGSGGGPPENIHPIHLPWRYKQWFKSTDWPSVRRGLQVYQEVFAPCHSLNYIHFIDFSAFMTPKEVKAFAAEFEVPSAPDDEGLVKNRPALGVDHLPRPFPNEQAARFANNGALPVDLSLIVTGRENGSDYLFSLLTSFGREPPAGMSCDGALVWNPYFPGGKLGMPPPLSDGMLDFHDGTPATVSQIAKDATNFLVWCADPNIDTRNILQMKVVVSLVILQCTALLYYFRDSAHFKFNRRWWRFPTRFIKPVL